MFSDFVSRIDLNVPFAEKDEAKRLGARWDANRKMVRAGECESKRLRALAAR